MTAKRHLFAVPNPDEHISELTAALTERAHNAAGFIDRAVEMQRLAVTADYPPDDPISMAMLSAAFQAPLELVEDALAIAIRRLAAQ